VPSLAHRRWATARSRELDEIEAAHHSVGGTGPGRRHATQQINRAYAVLLASHFQGFCRDLHTEAVDCLIPMIAPSAAPTVDFRATVKRQLLANRQLDHGNANQTTVGGDFGKLGVPDFWASVDVAAAGNDQRRQVLDRLNAWRNAIAHQDFDPTRLGGTTTLRLAIVQRWRRACRRLARSIDGVVRDHIRAVTGSWPW